MEEFGRAIDDIAKPEVCSSFHYHLISGKPSRAVLDFATKNKEDLIVLGLDHHRSLYGGSSLSHAYQIVCEATCPVLSICAAAATANSGC